MLVYCLYFDLNTFNSHLNLYYDKLFKFLQWHRVFYERGPTNRSTPMHHQPYPISKFFGNFTYSWSFYVLIHHIAALFVKLFVCFMIITFMALNGFHLSSSYTLYLQPHRTTQNLLPGAYKYIYKLICLAFSHYLCILISHYRFILKYYVSLLCFCCILIRFLASDIQYPYVYNPTLHYPPPIICVFYIKNRCFSTP
jgi:hypothetical protein